MLVIEGGVYVRYEEWWGHAERISGAKKKTAGSDLMKAVKCEFDSGNIRND